MIRRASGPGVSGALYQKVSISEGLGLLLQRRFIHLLYRGLYILCASASLSVPTS